MLTSMRPLWIRDVLFPHHTSAEVPLPAYTGVEAAIVLELTTNSTKSPAWTGTRMVASSSSMPYSRPPLYWYTRCLSK